MGSRVLMCGWGALSLSLRLGRTDRLFHVCDAMDDDCGNQQKNAFRLCVVVRLPKERREGEPYISQQDVVASFCFSTFCQAMRDKGREGKGKAQVCVIVLITVLLNGAGGGGGPTGVTAQRQDEAKTACRGSAGEPRAFHHNGTGHHRLALFSRALPTPPALIVARRSASLPHRSTTVKDTLPFLADTSRNLVQHPPFSVCA